jgi:hypothetical protein
VLISRTVAHKIFFSQLFRQFGILNCNLSDSLKNLPTLFQKWFEYASGGLSGEATEAGPHPHLSMNLNKNVFLRISILQICFYIIIIL